MVTLGLILLVKETMNKQAFEYSRKEDLINTFTHLIGVVLGIYFLFSFITKAVPVDKSSLILTSSFFSAGAILLFLASSSYHYTTNINLKLLLKKLDHSCIYFFIAASYTHYIFHHFEKEWTGTLLAIVWGLAMIGIIYKVFSKKRRLLFSVSTYIGFGLIFFFLKFFVKMQMSPEVFNWLLIGGIFYVSGSFIYAMKKVPHHHGVWHVFVLAGAVSHYISILYSVNQLSQ